MSPSVLWKPGEEPPIYTNAQRNSNKRKGGFEMLLISKGIAKILIMGLILSLVTISFPATASASPLDKVTFRMNWYWIGSQTPYFFAKERGYYKENGIDVEILEGRGSGLACQLVGNKSNDFGLASSSSIYPAIAKGIPIISVAILRQDDGYGVCFLKGTNIKTARDLEGKSIAVTPDDAPSRFLPGIIAKNNLDESKIKKVLMDAASKPVALMQGKVDALIGSITDQPVIMRAKGYDPQFIPFSEMGVISLGMSVIAHQDTVAKRPDLVRRFVAATLKGMLVAEKEGPEAVVDMFMKTYPERDRKVFINQLKDHFELLKFRRPVRYGFGNPGDVEATIEALRIKTDKIWRDFHTNEFIP